MIVVQICPPQMSDIGLVTLPWEIQKSHFIIHKLQIIYVSSEENKQQLLYCSIAVYLLLFGYLHLGHATGGTRLLIWTC